MSCPCLPSTGRLTLTVRRLLLAIEVTDPSVQKTDSDNVRALKIALVLTAVFFIVEIVAGFLNNSLALLSDAGHMLTDIMALCVSLYASYLMRRAPTLHKSYGYYRSEVLAALLNGIILWLVVGFIFYEAIQRLLVPQTVNGMGVTVVGAAGLIVNLIVAAMLHNQEDLNMKGAYLHVLTDAYGSAAALLSGILIYFTKWYTFDPLLSFVIGALVLYSSWSLIRDSINILMESVPKHLDPTVIRRSVMLCPGVENIHDLHIWSISSRSHALSAHIVVPPRMDPSEVRERVEQILRNEFELNHTTLQMEISEGCLPSHD
jgi:cobalt-zinc-cadmium efflux system protein